MTKILTSVYHFLFYVTFVFGLANVIGLTTLSQQNLALAEIKAHLKDKPVPLEIPRNGKFESRNKASRPKHTAVSPRVYLAQLNEEFPCLGPNCDEIILKQIKALIYDELRDFYGMLEFGGSQFLSNADVVYKATGLKVLIEFLNLHSFFKSAELAEKILFAHHDDICIGVKPSEEEDSSDDIECVLSETDPNCTARCMNSDIYSLIGALKEPSDTELLLDALSGADNNVKNYFRGACDISNIFPQVQSGGSMIGMANRDTKPLCGILESSSVITALARSSDIFIGGSQTNITEEYSCLEVHLNIDRSKNIWRSNPGKSEENFVIMPNGITKQLVAADFVELQNAVKYFTKLIRRQPNHLKKSLRN